MAHNGDDMFNAAMWAGYNAGSFDPFATDMTNANFYGLGNGPHPGFVESYARTYSYDDGTGIAPHQQPIPAHLRMPQQPTTAFRLASDVQPMTEHARLGNTNPAAAAPVPIPHQSSISQPSHTAPAASGPMSSSVVIPPRPRPGRKPMQQEDAADRRRLQNRIAQRNFRDKRQQKLVETQQELDERKRDYQTKISDLTRDLEQSRQENAQLKDTYALQLSQARQEIAQLRDQAENATKQFQAERDLRFSQEHAAQQIAASIVQPSLSINTTHRPANHGPLVPTPPDDDYHEIDFTNFYSRNGVNRTNTLKHPRTNEIHALTEMDMDAVNFRPEDSCGFCLDESNCMCAAAEREKKKRQVIAPGNCDACRIDPQRAQACRDLAERSQAMPPAQTTQASQLQNSVAGESLAPLRISCSNFIDRTVRQGERLSSISELFGSSLHAVPSRNGQGYEIEEHEAAQALSNLSNSRKHARAASRHDSNGFEAMVG